MRSRLSIICATVISVLAPGFFSAADTVAIQRTPILTATLSAGTTYQVETSAAGGGAWSATGVLVAGSGSANSVRLDGFPADQAYRYVRIGDGTIVTPAAVSGLHLAVSFPGATELRAESSSAVESGSWAPPSFVFPDAGGSFVHALRPPLQSREFFRAYQPAAPLALASLASYAADPATGYAGFGIVADDMPQLYRDGFICAVCPALYNRGGGNATAAGECYELTGPNGSVTVMVGDMEDAAPAGTCDIGRSYFDVGNPAYAALYPAGAGAGTATYRLAPAPVSGNIKLVVVPGANLLYFELRPYNHRAGVAKMEILQGTSWSELPRAAYNSFVYNTGSAVTFPFRVRVTSAFGEVVTFPPIAALSSGARLSADAQFTNFPALDPKPVWILPPVYADGLSSILGGAWSTSAFGGVTVDPAYAPGPFHGSASLRITNLGAFGGVVFTHANRFPAPADGVLEFAIKSGTSGSVAGLIVKFSGFDSGGTAASSASVSLPPIDATWRVIRIPLAPASVPAQLDQFRLQNNTSSAIASVLLDSISFLQR